MAEIRPAALADATLLRELRLRALADSPAAFASTVAEEADRPAVEWERLAAGVSETGAVVLVARDGERSVGMAGVRWYDAEAGVAQLWGMWVDPARRGTGLGRQLVDAACAWARAGGGRVLRLGVLEGAGEATGFYERLGFVATGERRPYTRDASRMVFWMQRAI